MSQRPLVRPIVRHVACPSCAATLGVPEGRRTLRCEHCETPTLVAVPGHAPRHRLAPRLDRKPAAATVREAVGRWPVRADVSGEAKFFAPQLYYVPFYEFRGRLVSGIDGASYRLEALPDLRAIRERKAER